MKLQWSAAAAASLAAFIELLHGVNPALSRVARRDIRLRAGRLCKHPFMARPSRWPGMRELSLTRWRKILVYRVEENQVRIVAFYDARQDLSRVTPKE